MENADARSMWMAIEPIHAVTYFHDFALSRMAESKLKGFWMTYFAARSAPLGPAAPAVVEALFYNFSPARASRALPAAWAITSPQTMLELRTVGAAVALGAVFGKDATEGTRRVLPLLEAAADAAHCEGRALAAANQRLARHGEPLERLWQATTTLREHRGDGHVAALVGAQLSGPEALVLKSATSGIPLEVFSQSRGWELGEVEAATEALAARGLVADDGTVTAAGTELAADIETTTDHLALQPYEDGLTSDGFALLLRGLAPLARELTNAGVPPFPNPIGLGGAEPA